MVRSIGNNNDLGFKSNISETFIVNISFAATFFKKLFDKLSNDIQVDRISICGFLVIDFKVSGIIGISMIVFFNISGTEKVEHIKKKLRKLVSQSSLKKFQQKPKMLLVF